jgi:hypothetical protein
VRIAEAFSYIETFQPINQLINYIALKILGGEYMFCPKCGTRRDDGGEFCGSCGNQFPIRQNEARIVASNVPKRQTQSSPRYDAPFSPNRMSNTVPRRNTHRQKGLNKRVLAIGGIVVIALIVLLVVTLGGNKGGLPGTWEDQEGNEWVFSDSSVWVIFNRRDGNSSHVYGIRSGTYFTIDSEIRFYGLDRGANINHYNIDGNNLFLGPIALTRVSSNQSPVPLNPRGITGTWEGLIRQIDGDDYIETISFSGSSFTTTSYHTIEVERRQIQSRDPNAPVYLPALPAPVPAPPLRSPDGLGLGSPLSMRGLQTEIERNDTTVVKFYTVSSTYDEIDYDIVRVTGRGTFSVSGNKIEFTLSDGSTITRDFFFSTEDVLSIGNSTVTKGETRR